MGAHEVYSETTFSCPDEVSTIFVPPTWGQGQMILLKVDSQAVTGERTKLQIDPSNVGGNIGKRTEYRNCLRALA